ncbi:threonine--tRNA ligase, partial [bacterium]|nr:threonine--tRNA ligase [bacterium]
PKIDIKIKDAIGREWQTTTIQFDFNLSERFDIDFVNDKGEKERPILIHRALLGSLERFFGVLIEHYKGDFPLWLSQVQCVILPVNDDLQPYAQEVREKLEAAGLRVEVDLRNERLGYKVRMARLNKTPYFIVVGESEKSGTLIKPTGRREGQMEAMTIDNFVEIVKKRLNSE